MAKEQDFGSKPFPITIHNEEEAKEAGKTLMGSLLKLRVPNLQKDALVERVMDGMGAKIGADMWRDKSPWTVNEFTGRFSKMVEKHS